MKHARHAALDSIEPVLIALRQVDDLREKTRGVFYRKSVAFIHFHEDSAGIFADLRRGSDWLRLPVNTAAERRRLVRLAQGILTLQPDPDHGDAGGIAPAEARGIPNLK